MRSLAVLANGNVGVAREVHRAGDVRHILHCLLGEPVARDPGRRSMIVLAGVKASRCCRFLTSGSADDATGEGDRAATVPSALVAWPRANLKG